MDASIRQLTSVHRRDQRTVCFAPRAAGRPCPPLDHARSATQPRALVTSGHSLDAAKAAGFRLRLGGGRCAPCSDSLCAPLRLRSTSPARRRQTEAKIVHIGKRVVEIVSQRVANLAFSNH